MGPSVDIVDEPFGRSKGFRKTFLEILQVELCHQGLRGDAVEARGVRDESSERRDGGSNESFHSLRVAACFDIALAQVNDVTPRLDFARAAQIRFRNADPLEHIRANYQASRGNDLAELERKGIERARELWLDKKQGDVEPELLPFRIERGTAFQIGECQALHQ